MSSSLHRYYINSNSQCFAVDPTGNGWFKADGVWTKEDGEVFLGKAMYRYVEERRSGEKEKDGVAARCVVV